MSEVDDDVCLLARRKRVAMNSGTLGRAEFDEDVVVVQFDGVKAGRGSFVAMLKTRSVALFSRARWTVAQCVEEDFTDSWHQQDVAIIGDAGAAEMCVAETVDDRIGVVITGAAVPAGESCIGAELDHAERPRRARKRVTMTSRADKRVDVAREILLRRNLRGRQDQQT